MQEKREIKNQDLKNMVVRYEEAYNRQAISNDGHIYLHFVEQLSRIIREHEKKIVEFTFADVLDRKMLEELKIIATPDPEPVRSMLPKKWRKK